jgi:hypothetical protein
METSGAEVAHPVTGYPAPPRTWCRRPLRTLPALIGEEHREVLAAIRRLPDRQREVLVLRYYLDLDEAEIARSMGIGQSTVRSTTSAGTVPPDGSPPLRLSVDAGLEQRRSRHGRQRAAGARWGAADCPGRGRRRRGGHRDRRARPDQRRSRPSRAALALVAAGRIPAYYLSLGPSLESTLATVRATATGAVLGTVRPPVKDEVFIAASAAADDRTFVLDAAARTGDSGARTGQNLSGRVFYLLRLASDGKPAGLRELPVSVPPARP